MASTTLPFPSAARRVAHGLRRVRRWVAAGATQLLFLAVSTHAYATTAGMPWETPANTILRSISGPLARVIGAVAIIAAGLGVAFSEGGSGMRKFLWVVLGLVIAFNAVSYFLSFLGFSGGLLV